MQCSYGRSAYIAAPTTLKHIPINGEGGLHKKTKDQTCAGTGVRSFLEQINTHKESHGLACVHDHLQTKIEQGADGCTADTRRKPTVQRYREKGRRNQPLNTRE